jgi:hypothetical protein
VIPRLNHLKYRSDKRLAFGRGEQARSLQIYIDSDRLAPSEELELLKSFGAHPHVDVQSTDASAPSRVIVGSLDQQHGYRPFDVERVDGSGFSSGVAGNAPDIARELAEPGEEAEAERVMTLARGAADHGCDALVTSNSLLLERFPRNLIEGANPMPPREAVAVLGLFLRVREDFVFEVSPNFRETLDRGTFYFLVARDLTPSGWRWFSACVDSADATKDDDLLLTAQSGMERLDRALRARDRLHETLQVPATRDSATEAIFYLDVTLLMLGGAFDAAAVVAHRVEQLGGSERRVGWGSKDWLKEIARTNRPLAMMMARGQPHRDARELVAVMRNTIHSQALRSVTWQIGAKRDERVVVPDQVASDLEQIVKRRGTPADFGLSRHTDGRLYVDLGVYVDAVLPPVADALNAIMDETRVERLPGVDATKLSAGPPNEGIFRPEMRGRVRVLAGL